MKTPFFFFLVFICFNSINAQNTIAKFKYEDAEKAFYKGNYQTCLDNLDEAEKLLGKSAPNILYLRIVSENKLLQPHPLESYEKLAQLREHCDFYLKNYDIQGLENKYRDVYEINNSLEDLPTTQELFDEAVKQRQVIAAQQQAEQEKIWAKNRKIIDSLLPMVNVEGGTFLMGLKDKKSLSWAERSSFQGYLDAMPQHQVSVCSFNIAVFETTNAAWDWVMGAQKSNEENQKKPKTVSWQQTQLFIEKLNALTGRHYRLPTEAEWEFAAKGGNKSKGYLYSGSDNKNQVSWNGTNNSFFKSKNPKLHEVGQKDPNELGIYDMTGNVWEWCNDWYDPEFYKTSLKSAPEGPRAGSRHVARGGSLQCIGGCAIVNRSYGMEVADGYIGFRLVINE